MSEEARRPDFRWNGKSAEPRSEAHSPRNPIFLWAERFWRQAPLLSLALLINAAPLQAEEKKTAVEEAIERRQKVQLMSFFLKDPKDAVLPQTPLAIELYNEAVGYFQKQEYDLARQVLKDSLAQDNKNFFAYELLGDIDYLQQNLADAKANYEIAYNLQPTPELKKKLEKIQTEAPVEKKLATYAEEHFLIKYYNEKEKIVGFELRELLRTTYRNISQDFGYYFRHQVVVLLYDEEDFKKLTNLPHWVGGVYDGKVRMPMKRVGFGEDDLKAVTAHEMTHAFVAAMSEGKAPAWINEGLAQYEENKVREIDLLVFRSAVKTNTLLSLDQLLSHRVAVSEEDPLLVSLFYQESFHLARYLAGRYHLFALKQILAAFGKGKNSEEALEEVLHISTDRLEKEWRATFSN